MSLQKEFNWWMNHCNSNDLALLLLWISFTKASKLVIDVTLNLAYVVRAFLIFFLLNTEYFYCFTRVLNSCQREKNTLKIFLLRVILYFSLYIVSISFTHIFWLISFCSLTSLLKYYWLHSFKRNNTQMNLSFPEWSWIYWIV